MQNVDLPIFQLESSSVEESSIQIGCQLSAEKFHKEFLGAGGGGIEVETDRREGKDRRCCLGDVLECRTSHFAVRMI